MSSQCLAQAQQSHDFTRRPSSRNFRLETLQAASDFKRLIIVQGTYSTARIVLGERRFPALAE
jgi:hypothetical protein